MKKPGSKLFKIIAISAMLLTSNLSFALSDKVIASANGMAITQQEQNNYQKVILALNPNVKNNKETSNEILKTLINHKIILARLADNKFSFPQDAIDNKVKQLYLSTKNDKASLTKKGVSSNILEDYAKGQMALELFIQNTFKDDLTVTDREISQFKLEHADDITNIQIEDIHLPTAHIGNSSEANYYNMIIDGKVIPQGAKTNVIPMQRLGNLPKIFKDNLTGLNTGQYSKTIKANNGYHVLKVIGKETVSDLQIKEHLYINKINKVIKKANKKIIDETIIEYIN